MKKIILLFLLFPVIIYSQVIMSWNIQDLGKAKYQKDTIIPAIANVMIDSKADIIAIQEVVVNSYGDSCIIQLAKLLKYNYIISDRTTGDGVERYAYLYNKDILLNYATLDIVLEDVINREPYIASFKYNCKNILIRQVHIVPNNKNPQQEIAQLYNYKSDIICGDFNLTDKHLIYIPLLSNFNSPLYGLPTTLKTDGTISENSYDHFLVDKKIKVNYQYVYDYTYHGNRKLLSDHLPIIIIL